MVHRTDYDDGNQSIVALDLYQKIVQRKAKVGVVGLGYVGLPTMLGVAKSGFTVTGIDIEQSRVDRIND